ncbi:glycoside hydrolase family 2 TIM barrel-domain containing protein [Flavonifractor hominis]|uniref:Glycoside hydrolase family 2 TIM barrel-domain containing protein n=1 Tax=Flavonifractor hominis TaxID=3133178 RepID=A0ABV1EQV8_9FIRM
MKGLGKKLVALVCTCSLLSSIALAAAPQTDSDAAQDQASAVSVSVAQETGSVMEKINDDWKYAEDVEDASAEEYDDASWQDVQLPHTWNAEDGADGGSYRRGTSWYRKSLEWKEEYAGKQLFLSFLGSSMETDVYVNGVHAGNHKGGYTAFRFDITDLVEEGEPIQIAVKVNNERQDDILPLGGDFTVFGGIYRDVYLIACEPVHLDMMDYGSSGVYLTPTVEEDGTGTLSIRAKLVNEEDSQKDVTVSVTLSEPDGFTGIDAIETTRFDPEEMGDGSEVGTTSSQITLSPNGSGEWTGSIKVEDLHLWNGVEDPFRYVAELTVQVDGQTMDTCTQYIGFRTFEVDPDKGFILNGEPYALRGVSRHQDGYDVTGETYLGSALTPAEHERDMGLIYEMGANYIRLAHYPQDPYFYELCDRYGMVVWAEIPMVGGVTESEAFQENAEQQLIELIRQQYNHPSICFWGVANEISSTDFVVDMISDLNDLAHQEDPTRLTTYAAERNGVGTWDTDLICWNIYPDWYYEGTVEGMMSERRGELSGNKPVGISEYGAGANINQHEDPPQFSIGQSRGQWHPEEYQSVWHEDALREIKQLDYLWATAVWNMFDFGSDGRDEGGQKGVNDKGLVTIDRQTKKDAFYLYKANWNNWDPFVHINASRLNPREDAVITVRAYSNCDEVSLEVNGQSYGTVKNDGLGVFEWPDVPLQLGENTVKTVGYKDGDPVSEDTVTWTRQEGSTARLASSSDQVVVDNPNYTITLLDTVTADELNTILSGVNGTTWGLYEANQTTPVTGSTEVTMDMVIKAVSQNGEDNQVYRFASSNLAAYKDVTASTQLADYPASNAVDLDGTTFWSADRGTKAEFVVDLGEVYHLNNITVEWYNTGSNARTYRYTVEVSDNGEDYTVVVDRSKNDQVVDTDSRRLRIKDEMDQVTGRYVKINISGGPSWSECAEISEIVLNGWRMSSDTYQINEQDHTILVPRPQPGVELTWTEFAQNLKVEGTHRSAVEHNTSAYFVLDGDQWMVTDSDGNETLYTVRFTDEVFQPATGVKLDEESVYLYNNYGPSSVQLTATVEPAEASQHVTWTSSDPSVATVSDTGLVTVVGEGMTTITATTADGNFTADCLVQVGVYNTGDNSGESGSSTGGSTTEPEQPGETTEPEQPGETTEPETPAFSDVPATHWASEAVDYVVSEGLFNGTSDTTFSPDASMTRAMFFTVLARLDGVDTTGGATWYEKAMTWAVAEGITDGTNPEATITREQLAVMLYRYAGSPATEGSLTGFADASSVSAWAQDAMEWAVAEGILTGKDGSALDPQGTASRAEVATMLMRFVQSAE